MYNAWKACASARIGCTTIPPHTHMLKYLGADPHKWENEQVTEWHVAEGSSGLFSGEAFGSNVASFR